MKLLSAQVDGKSYTTSHSKAANFHVVAQRLLVVQNPQGLVVDIQVGKWAGLWSDTIRYEFSYSSLRLERLESERSVGRGAAGAVAGGILLGGLGALAGAAMGAQKRHSLVAHTERGNLVIEANTQELQDLAARSAISTEERPRAASPSAASTPTASTFPGTASPPAREAKRVGFAPRAGAAILFVSFGLLLAFCGILKDAASGANTRRDREAKLRGDVPHVIAALAAKRSELSAAMADERPCNNLLPEIRSLASPYMKLSDLPAAMVVARDAALRDIERAAPLCTAQEQARERATEAEQAVQRGVANASQGEFAIAEDYFNRAIALLSALDVGYRARHTHLAELLDLASRRAREIAPQARRQKAEFLRESNARKAKVDKQRPVTSKADAPRDLEAILRERCGAPTDKNGYWKMEGAKERAECRVRVELALERDAKR